MKTVFIRAIEADVNDKAAVIKAAISKTMSTRYEFETSDFRYIPGSPFAYWISISQRDIFLDCAPLSSADSTAVSGGKTLDDFRWIRASWEVSHEQKRWIGYAKGGSFSPFYADIHLRLDWKNNAAALKDYLVEYRRSRG